MNRVAEQLTGWKEKEADGAREVFDFYSSRAAASRVTLHVNIKTEQQSFGNPGELRQVLSNLLANSLDACKEGDAICVRVRPRDPALSGVRIAVADTGCGIHPEQMESVFEPFFTTKKDTGTELGLWVSRELIEKRAAVSTPDPALARAAQELSSPRFSLRLRQASLRANSFTHSPNVRCQWAMRHERWFHNFLADLSCGSGWFPGASQESVWKAKVRPRFLNSCW